MHYMHDLKDLLCAELEDYAENGKKSGKMSMGDLESIHKLTDTVKNILKIDMLEEESGYSEDGHYMGEGRIYGTSYESGYSARGGSSYARGGRGGNRGYSSEGGYSREDGKHYLMGELERLMKKAGTHTEREALEECMQALERA